ncbi:MAG: carboxypeptidase regulatory-like domain-containing protein [Saprospiraceae bacterium]|nr:carboxypeptidase regulatory-like domain-containing protein [Saprospiraceae bacterium]
MYLKAITKIAFGLYLLLVAFSAYSFTCSDRILGLKFNKLDGGPDITIDENGSYLPVGTAYNLEAISNSSATGSVRFTISGPAGNNIQNLETSAPWNSGYSLNSVGSYTVFIEIFSSNTASSANKCHDTTFHFTISNCTPPNAGPDKSTPDIYSAVALGATSTSGASWVIAASNPGYSELSSTSSATAIASAFMTAGTYKYIWTKGGCSDTMQVVVGSCNCDNNLILNPSFESGNPPANWTATQPYNVFQSDAYAAQCGSGHSAQQDGLSNSNLASFYQDVSIAGGLPVTLKFKAGTHVPGDVAKFGLIFFNGNTRLDSVFLEVDHVLGASGSMEGYTINANAPASANKVRVIGKTGADWLKVDLVCLQGTAGSACDGNRITGLFFNELSTGNNVTPIQVGGSFDVSTLSDGLRNLEATVSGNVESVKFTITGPTASNNIENLEEWNAPGTGTAWIPAAGNYSVRMQAYTQDNAAGSLCHDTTISFTLTDLACSCPGNILSNPSFENNGGSTTGWSSSTPGYSGKFYAGDGFNVCGSYNAFLDARNATNNNPFWFYQQVNSVTPGNMYTLSIYGGTHEPSGNHAFLLSFYNSSGVRLSRDSVQIDYDVDVNPGLQQYTLAGTAPTGTSYLRVEGRGVGDYIKVDLACLTLTGNCPTVNAGADGTTSICNTSTTAINLFNLITGENAGGVWSRLTGTGGTFSGNTFTPAANATTSTFRYIVAGAPPCPGDTSIATVVITPPVSAGTDGMTTVCSNSALSINLFNLITGEQSGGTWSRTSGSGGSFTASTGTFVPTGATSSIFRYILIGSSPCPNDTSFASVSVTTGVNAGTDGSTAICNTSTSPINLFSLISGEEGGGTWSRISGSGGTFSGNTFTPALNATTSMFRYILTGSSPCPNDTSMATVNITGPAAAGVDGSTSICNSSVTPINLFDLIAGEASGGTWTRISGSNGSFSGSTFTPSSNATTSSFRYVVNGASPCPNDTSIATVNISVCCDGRVTSVYFNRLDGGDDIPIINGQAFGINTLGSLYNLEAGFIGTIGSMKFSITGPAANTNVENSVPYNAPGGDTPFTPAVGTYVVNIKVYNQSDAGGSICHDTTITFDIFDPGCSCPDNILLNPSFENNGGSTTGWSSSTPGYTGKFYQGTGFDVCGSYNAFLDARNASNSNPFWFWQQVNGVTPGSQYSLSIYGGTHDPGKNHAFLLSFYNAGGTRLSRDSVQVDYDVDINPGLQLYLLQGIAPTGTSYLRVEGRGVGDYLKVDLACLTLSSQPASLGDYVWYDKNENGIQDGGELPAPGKIIKLYTQANVLVGMDTTDVNGIYGFSNLPPGNYYISFDTTGTGFKLTKPNVGNDAFDSDIDTITGKSGNITLASGQIDLKWDVGLVARVGASIGDPCTCHDIIYLRDELYEVLDELIINGTPGSVWTILSQTGMEVIDTLANMDLPASGTIIPEVSPGLYKLKFSHDVGVGYMVTVSDGIHTLSYSNLCIVSKLITSIDPIFSICGVADPITLTGSATLGGNPSPGTVSFTINGQPATIFNPALYAPGTTVTVIVRFTPQNTQDCPQMYKYDILIEPSGCQASLGDRAWYDLNRNGIQDNIIDPLDGSIVGPEWGAPGLIIELHRSSNDALVAKDTTDSNGYYLFTGLPAGDYYIKLVVSSLPTGFVVSPTDANGNTQDAADNDIMHITYRSASTTLVSGENDLTWDIGINHSGSPNITDPCGCVEEYIYTPDNQNYIYSEEVAVEATPGGIWRIIAINNATGNTTYGIMQDGPSADFLPQVLVPQPFGVALTVVSPGVFHYDFYHQEPLGYGIVVTDGIDTLEYQSACISVQEEFDQSIRSICAFSPTLNLPTVFPDGTVTYYFLQNGAFHFIDNFDEYMAQFIAAAQNPPITTLNPLNYSPGDTIALYMRWLPNGNVGVPGTGLCPKTLVLNIAVEADVTDCAAGIGNFVWNDQDADGHQDAGEPGIPGVIVTLTNIGTNAMRDTLTDANGRYFFGSIPPGTYKVTFGTPAGFIPTTANAAGVLDDVDSDAGAGGMTGNYVLVAGQVDSTVDAGFRLPPDLTPTISLSPSSFVVSASNPNRQLRMFVRLSEILNQPTNGTTITIQIVKDNRFTFTYNPALTSLGTTTLENTDWTFDNSNPVFWIWRTNKVIPGLNSTTFWITGKFQHSKESMAPNFSQFN